MVVERLHVGEDAHRVRLAAHHHHILHFDEALTVGQVPETQKPHQDTVPENNQPPHWATVTVPKQNSPGACGIQVHTKREWECSREPWELLSSCLIPRLPQPQTTYVGHTEEELLHTHHMASQPERESNCKIKEK